MATCKNNPVETINNYIAHKWSEAPYDRPTYKKVQDYIVIDGYVEAVKTVVVHSFHIDSSFDTDIYAAEPLINWERSDIGQWVMKHSLEPPTWHSTADVMTFQRKYIITAKLTGPSLTEYLLRGGTLGA